MILISPAVTLAIERHPIPIMLPISAAYGGPLSELFDGPEVNPAPGSTVTTLGNAAGVA
jgi:hypothetical protein